jgi:hypothetical protein
MHDFVAVWRLLTVVKVSTPGRGNGVVAAVQEVGSGEE